MSSEVLSRTVRFSKLLASSPDEIILLLINDLLALYQDHVRESFSYLEQSGGKTLMVEVGTSVGARYLFSLNETRFAEVIVEVKPGSLTVQATRDWIRSTTLAVNATQSVSPFSGMDSLSPYGWKNPSSSSGPGSSSIQYPSSHHQRPTFLASPPSISSQPLSNSASVNRNPLLSTSPPSAQRPTQFKSLSPPPPPSQSFLAPPPQLLSPPPIRSNLPVSPRELAPPPQYGRDLSSRIPDLSRSPNSICEELPPAYEDLFPGSSCVSLSNQFNASGFSSLVPSTYQSTIMEPSTQWNPESWRHRDHQQYAIGENRSFVNSPPNHTKSPNPVQILQSGFSNSSTHLQAASPFQIRPGVVNVPTQVQSSTTCTSNEFNFTVTEEQLCEEVSSLLQPSWTSPSASTLSNTSAFRPPTSTSENVTSTSTRPALRSFLMYPPPPPS